MVVITTVTFFVAIGMMLATCATSADKRRERFTGPEIGRGIGHKHQGNNISDILLSPPSESEITRRTFGMVPIEKLSKPRYWAVESKHKFLIENCKQSVIFYNNINHVFSYLLHGHQNGFTEEQYTSLHMINEIIKKKMVNVYNMLYVLPRLKYKSKAEQTVIILTSLIKNLPVYLSCAAKFLITEIQQRRINLDVMLQETKFESCDYLANIDRRLIVESKVAYSEEETKVYAKYTTIIQKLFELQTNNAFVPQKIFGLIIINLPNFRNDPILEENIRFLYEVVMTQTIINWNTIVANCIRNDVYSLVNSVLFQIYNNPSVDYAIKRSAYYIRKHLKIATSTYANPAFKYTYDLTKQEIDVGLLLSAIVPQEFDENAVHMKNLLLKYLLQSHKDKYIYEALRGFNKFNYCDDPMNLLMAFLTRILCRIPASKIEIKQTAVALLSSLIIKKHARIFTPYVSSDVDILVLLGCLRNPDLDPAFVKSIDAIKLELTLYPRICETLSTFIPKEKDKCLIPRQCLINTFQKLQEQRIDLPITISTKIQNLLHTLQTTVSSHTFSEQYSFIEGDTNYKYKNPVIPNNIYNEFTENGKLDVSHTKEVERSAGIESVGPVFNYSDNWTHHTTTQRILLEDYNSEAKYSQTVESSNSQNMKYIESNYPTSIGEVVVDDSSKLEVKETLEYENSSTTVILPPLVEYNRPLKLVMSESGVLVVTTEEYNREDNVKLELILPQIDLLLRFPDINNFFVNVDTPIVTEVLQPLAVIFGKNYIIKILKDVNVKLYTTNIALLIDICKRAKNSPQVARRPELVVLIQKYIACMEYVAPTIILPIMCSIKKFTSHIVYSSFSLQNPTYCAINEIPPLESSTEIVTIPIVNPTVWLEPINPSHPCIDLIPTLPKGDAFEILLRPLKNILIYEKIVEILGSDFKPLMYPNKGALLVTILQRLQKVQTIQVNKQLKSIIDLYIRAIEIPAIHSKVPQDIFSKVISGSTVQWRPELNSLIECLPVAKTEIEIEMSKTIQYFLSINNILERLHIIRPSLTISRAQLLYKIIQAVLSGTIHLESQVINACKYYKNRIIFSDIGALPITWTRVHVFKTEVKLGDMIQKTLNFEKLSYQEKLAYNNFVTYLAENPRFLQNNDYFAFEKYKTQGEFVVAFMKYLLQKQQISIHVKNDIQALLPHVTLVGSGAVLIPSFSKIF